MPRAPLSQACLVLVATIALASAASAQNTALIGRVHEMPLPASLPPAIATRTGEPVTHVRSQSLLDFIRRTYNSPRPGVDAGRGITAAPPVIEVHHTNGSGAERTATLPLPLPASVWTETVFGGRETSATLLDALLRSRGPALLYYGLLSLDDDTRTWLATEPELLTELAGPRAPAFVVAAPGLRIRGTAVAVPGGEAARLLWESLVGHTTTDPAGFTRELLRRDDGRLALFFASMAQLTPKQLQVALRLSADADTRLDAARRLRAVFDRLTAGWRADDNVFWRPAIDPALLVTNLQRDAAGMPVVPGTRAFWTAALSTNARRLAEPVPSATSAAAAEAPVDVPWISEQVFTGHRTEDRRRSDVVLFVSRMQARDVRWAAPAAIEAVRAARIYPALVFSLERARLVDLGAFVAAARRAETIAAIDDTRRSRRALAQFQGALALVTRAALRGGVQTQTLSTTITSLSGVELSDKGEYDGGLVRWLAAWLSAQPPAANAPADATAAGPVEDAVLAVLAGPSALAPRLVEWEGTRYRLDFGKAERTRISRILGEQARPFLSAARALVDIAESIAHEGTDFSAYGTAIETIATSVGWDPADGWDQTDCPDRYSDAHTALERAARTGKLRNASRLAADLRALADDLLARGLMEMAYAVAFGQPDRATISPDLAARRHDFASNLIGGRSLAWELPSSGSVNQRGWHVTGSLLGLDVRLAEFALMRLSPRPPATKPTVVGEQRRVLVEAVVLVDPASLEDADRAVIVSAIRAGRTRLTGARTAADAAAIADDLRLSPFRRTLLAWTVTTDRERLPAFLSMSELLWLGLEQPAAARLHAWGAPAWPRTGCLCLEVLERQPLEILAGRTPSGALASGFPDLNLRLAELLEELQMPASLLAPVLAAATLDLVENAAARDADDHDALLTFVQSLRRDRVEEYLALLTGDGPLVPADAGGAE